MTLLWISLDYEHRKKNQAHPLSHYSKYIPLHTLITLHNNAQYIATTCTIYHIYYIIANICKTNLFPIPPFLGVHTHSTYIVTHIYIYIHTFSVNTCTCLSNNIYFAEHWTWKTYFNQIKEPSFSHIFCNDGSRTSQVYLQQKGAIKSKPWTDGLSGCPRPQGSPTSLGHGQWLCTNFDHFLHSLAWNLSEKPNLSDWAAKPRSNNSLRHSATSKTKSKHKGGPQSANLRTNSEGSNSCGEKMVNSCNRSSDSHRVSNSWLGNFVKTRVLHFHRNKDWWGRHDLYIYIYICISCMIMHFHHYHTESYPFKNGPVQDAARVVMVADRFRLDGWQLEMANRTARQSWLHLGVTNWWTNK